MKAKAADFILYDQATGTYRVDPEQAVRDDVEKHYWLHVGRTVAKDWRLYVMLIPMLLVFLLWRYFPMYELLGCFKVDDTVKSVNEQFFAGFSNFKLLLTGGTNPVMSREFWRAMRNTFLLSFYGLLFGFPMPIILALFFNEIKSNGFRSVLQVMTYLPKFMSTVVMTSLVIMLVKQGVSVEGAGESMGGIVSQLLVAIGLVSEDAAKAGLLNDPAFFRTIYQVSGIWEGAGYDSIVFFAAVIAISPTSYEAAQIDGANKWAQMRYVVLPSILSTVVIMLITRIGHLLSVGYEKVILLYDVKTYQTADVVSTFSYRYGMSQGGQVGLASAAEMMNNVVGMLLVIGANTIAKKASNTSLY